MMTNELKGKLSLIGGTLGIAVSVAWATYGIALLVNESVNRAKDISRYENKEVLCYFYKEEPMICGWKAPQAKPTVKAKK